MRVCVIGNSHFAAIKQGWDSLPELAQTMELTFFGSPGSMLRTLEVTDGCLCDSNENVRRYIATTSGGLERIDGAAYNFFMVVSLELSFAIAADLYALHRLPEHYTRGVGLISRKALESSLIGAMRDTLAAATIAKIRKISAAPVMLISAPLPNPAIQRHPRYRRLWNGTYLSFLLDLYNDRLAAFGDELGVTTYTQPERTLLAPCFTDPIYAMEDDVSGIHHMNRQFGKELLRDITPRLQKILGCGA